MMAPWDLDKQEASMACERGRWIWVAGMTWLALAGCSFPGYGFPVEGNAGQSGEGGSGGASGANPGGNGGQGGVTGGAGGTGGGTQTGGTGATGGTGGG